jgi:uncharacterized membrane protein
METEAIRNVLREGTSKSLSRKRKIALLSAFGLIDFSIISLYQLGVIKKLPDLPWRIFDSNMVNASKTAYMMGVPDGPITLMSYALNLTMVGAGGTESTGRSKLFDVVLAGSVIGGALGGAYYLNDMIRNQKKACVYCLIGAALNFAMVPLVIKEIRNKFKSISV